MTYRGGYSSKKVTYKEGASHKKELLVQPNKTYQLWSWHNIRANSWYRSSQLPYIAHVTARQALWCMNLRFYEKNYMFGKK